MDSESHTINTDARAKTIDWLAGGLSDTSINAFTTESREEEGIIGNSCTEHVPICIKSPIF